MYDFIEKKWYLNPFFNFYALKIVFLVRRCSRTQSIYTVGPFMSKYTSLLSGIKLVSKYVQEQQQTTAAPRQHKIQQLCYIML